MKIILSRKGFDGSNGGIPSPVLPDGAMYSLPIPDGNGVTRYSELRFGEKSCLELLRDLNPKGNYDLCHADPDIDPAKHLRLPAGWKPAFGQTGAARSYLQNTAGVREGDLFLFFGNFHFVEMRGGSWQYVRRGEDFFRCNDFQAVWGWLQVGQILTDPWDIRGYPWHPHSADRMLSNPLNALYLPAERLSFAPELPGCGCFSFSEKRILTLRSENKGTWKENPVYLPDSVTGSRKNSAKGAGVYYAGIWQELALRETGEAEAWAKGLFRP